MRYDKTEIMNSKKSVRQISPGINNIIQNCIIPDLKKTINDSKFQPFNTVIKRRNFVTFFTFFNS